VVTACLLNSHQWLHDRLTEDAGTSATVSWTEDPRAADVVIYPVPPWRDHEAPQRLAALRPDVARRVFIFSQEDRPVLWAPGVFASVPIGHRYVASARGGFYVSHANYEPEHAETLQPRPHGEAVLLWCFVGSVSTCPEVRQPLVELKDERGHTLDTAAWLQQRWQLAGPGRHERARSLMSYADTLHRAKFIACPRGVGASSIRLFEAMRVGRCPVIVSDDWLPPPLVDWESCAIRIAEKDLGHLPAILREREGDAEALGRQARAIWEQRYAPPTMLNTLVESCLDIAPERLRARPRLAMAGRAGLSRESARRTARALERIAKTPAWRSRR
jgi:hypothetical protein